jgi:hypothetical protein
MLHKVINLSKGYTYKKVHELKFSDFVMRKEENEYGEGLNIWMKQIICLSTHLLTHDLLYYFSVNILKGYHYH